MSGVRMWSICPNPSFSRNEEQGMYTAAREFINTLTFPHLVREKENVKGKLSKEPILDQPFVSIWCFKIATLGSRSFGSGL